MEKHIAEGSISEHPNLQGIQRKVIVFAFIPNSDNKTLRVQYRIEHYSNGEKLNIQPQNAPDWIIDNNKSVTVRDLLTFQVIQNPFYEPKYSEHVLGKDDEVIEEPKLINAHEEFTMQGWDYFYYYAWENVCPVALKNFFEFYIYSLDTEDQFFNFY